MVYDGMTPTGIQALTVRADLWLCACVMALRVIGCVLAGMGCTAASAWLGYLISKRKW